MIEECSRRGEDGGLEATGNERVARDTRLYVAFHERPPDERGATERHSQDAHEQNKGVSQPLSLYGVLTCIVVPIVVGGLSRCQSTINRAVLRYSGNVQ